MNKLAKPLSSTFHEVEKNDLVKGASLGGNIFFSTSMIVEGQSFVIRLSSTNSTTNIQIGLDVDYGHVQISYNSGSSNKT